MRIRDTQHGSMPDSQAYPAHLSNYLPRTSIIPSGVVWSCLNNLLPSLSIHKFKGLYNYNGSGISLIDSLHVAFIIKNHHSNPTIYLVFSIHNFALPILFFSSILQRTLALSYHLIELNKD